MSELPVMLSAIAPSNRLTLGNYLGAVNQWVPAQDAHRPYFFIVDMHAITVPTDPEALREQTYLAFALYLAAGLDPEKSTIFVQSHVPEHAQLAWVLQCLTNMGELNRMTQFKDKSAKQRQVGVGLFTYPTLMAADILLYDAERIPVGADQKQHVELTRDLALRVNNRFGEDTFVVPEPYIPKAGARIMSLQEPTKKMSKSDPNDNGSVFLTDTNKQIEKKIKRAVTDSGDRVEWSDDKPGVKNLLEIQRALTGKATETLVADYEGRLYGHLKVDTAELVVETLGPIRDEALRLLEDKGHLDKLLADAALRARGHASKTLARTHERVGFVTPRSG